MKKIPILLVVLLLVSLYCNPVQAGFGGGGTGNCNHFFNPSPSNWEEDVEITDKGVQTCINITIDQGCVANVTFQWFNWTEYYGNWDDWFENPVGDPPSFYNETYWYNYSSWTNVNVSMQLCAWNVNVSCYTAGAIPWFDWRVIGNFSCSQDYIYNETCYYFFYPEECPLFYIYPSWNATNICPCCDAMCVGINNLHGHTMNITVYRNDTMNESFYIVNKYIEILNGTYCFCIDGHMDDMYYPMKYNETYHWYVNVTDTSTGEYNVSDAFSFRTAENLSLCPCGLDAIESICEDTDTIRDDAWIVGVVMMLFVLGYAINNKKVKRRKR